VKQYKRVLFKYLNKQPIVNYSAITTSFYNIQLVLKPTTHLQPVPRLRMLGVYIQSDYDFMAWYSFKQRDNLFDKCHYIRVFTYCIT
jgi:hypothetical protein